MPTRGWLLVWDFKKKGHLLNVRTDGQLVFNNGTAILKAALAGFGLGFYRRIGQTLQRDAITFWVKSPQVQIGLIKVSSNTPNPYTKIGFQTFQLRIPPRLYLFHSA